MALEFHVGDVATVRVIMRDAQGAETDSYDQVSGIEYATTHPDSISVTDTDAEPRDAEIAFSAPTPDGEDAFITCGFDGDPGDGVRRIDLTSDAIHVLAAVEGGAVSGELVIEMHPVPAPPTSA